MKATFCKQDGHDHGNVREKTTFVRNKMYFNVCGNVDIYFIIT